MNLQKKKQLDRWRRHKHLRKKLVGTAERPRLNIFRSNAHIYCQIIDDTHVDATGNRSGKTLAAISTRTVSVRGKAVYGGNVQAAEVVGAEIAKLAKEKGVTKVAFDRGGYRYHGRIKALAEAARKEGLDF